MEGAVADRICYQREVPFIVIRSISDASNENAGTELEAFYCTSAHNANLMVLGPIRRMEEWTRYIPMDS